MSLDAPEFAQLRADGLRFGIVVGLFNPDLTRALLDQVTARLQSLGAEEEDIHIRWVPGSNEAPYSAHMLAASGAVDAVVVLGVVIAGDTRHHETIALSTAISLHSTATRTGIPVINGIIVTETRAQAESRCRGEINRGLEFANAAIFMAGEAIDFDPDLEVDFEAENDSDSPIPFPEKD